MPDFELTRTLIENSSVEITKQDGATAITDPDTGRRLLIDEHVDVSDLWDAFENNIDTSEFFQDSEGMAALISEYDGVELSSTQPLKAQGGIETPSLKTGVETKTAPSTFSESTEANIALPSADQVRIILTEITTESSGQDAHIRLSDDGGVSYFNSADDYEWVINAHDSEGVDRGGNASDDDKIALIQGLRSSGTSVNFMQIDITGHNRSNRVPKMSWVGGYVGSNGSSTTTSGSAHAPNMRNVVCDMLKISNFDDGVIDIIRGRVLTFSS